MTVRPTLAPPKGSREANTLPLLIADMETIRETFGFEGSPIRINVRVREKRGARSR